MGKSDDYTVNTDPGGFTEKPEKTSTDPEILKAEIAALYLNEQLEKALLAHGEIPSTPVETLIGVGFVDIVDYSYLSSWLSPRENQAFLNGLYTAFHTVLKENGGYLNKISGDSLMFHIGGNIDASTKNLNREETEAYIARTLLKTCTAIQRTCRLFNRADKEFLSHYDDEESRNALKRAFLIISNLRENLAMVSGINAMFQVKVRIGACMGEVCIGNFGPRGACQWDIIGEPVIEARRMESTAPVDGLRISRSLYDNLKKNGLIDSYYKDFRKEARDKKGYYSDINIDELFCAKNVVLQDKKNADFDSYAVQTNPFLPEDIKNQVRSYLEKDEDGAERIIKIIQYYRGSRLVTKAVEDLFNEKNIRIRKADLYKKLHPRRYQLIFESLKSNEKSADRFIDRKVPLFVLFRILGHYQDSMNSRSQADKETSHFSDFNSYIREQEQELQHNYQKRIKIRERFLYFSEFLFPLFFNYLKASILEYQTTVSEVRDIQQAS